ncbi:MAG: hypothetical protein SangKO_094540 [Sandaracinaceae bacterium]
MGRLLAVWLALAALAPSVASAWCQSLSVTRATGRCDAPCLSLSDFSAEEIAERRIVPLAWRQPCIRWTLHPRGTDDLPRDAVQPVIAGAFSRWESVDCGGAPVGFRVEEREVPGLLCDYVDFDRDRPDMNVILFAEDWSDRRLDPRAFALTTTWFDVPTGEILGADIELNDERRTWAVCPEDGCRDGRIDLENVVVHELGHFFGLAHSPDDALATMWACAEAGETFKRTLEADDREGWCAIYAGALESTCSPPPEGELPLRCTFVGDDCAETEPAACGYCEDLGSGPVCTIPCESDPDVCPNGFACEPLGPGDAPRCVATGCGCRVTSRSPRASWAFALLALSALARRRRGSQRRR